MGDVGHGACLTPTLSTRASSVTAAPADHTATLPCTQPISILPQKRMQNDEDDIQQKVADILDQDAADVSMLPFVSVTAVPFAL